MHASSFPPEIVLGKHRYGCLEPVPGSLLWAVSFKDQALGRRVQASVLLHLFKGISAGSMLKQAVFKGLSYEVCALLGLVRVEPYTGTFCRNNNKERLSSGTQKKLPGRKVYSSRNKVCFP